MSECDAQPTQRDCSCILQGQLYSVNKNGLKAILLKSLNKNQMLILSSIRGFEYITPLLSSLSDKYDIPLSTLKFNAKVLQRLGMIEFDNSEARLTRLGKLILKIVNEA